MDGAKGTYKDYYYILGLRPEATSKEIEEAYQDLYNRFGPHVNISGQDPDSMIKAYKDICEAYDILGDPDKRREYDQTNLPHLQKTHLRQLWGKITGSHDVDQKNTNEPDPQHLDVEITLKEAIKGATRSVRIDEQLPCQSCIQLKPVQRLKCEQCRGAAHIHNMRTEELDIPAGAYDKQELRFPRRGKLDIRTGKNADLVAILKLRPHAFFNVMGRDLTCTVPITVLEAVLGGEIQVPSATGKVTMKIQPLTQNGRMYRLKGMGLAGADLLVTMQVVVPPQITADELELFRKLQSVSTMKNPRQEIFDKLASQQNENQ